MITLEGIYTTEELAKMAATAQYLANLARDMSNMLIYCDRPEYNAKKQQDGIQAAFSELHAIVLGLEVESLTGAHMAPDGGYLSVGARHDNDTLMTSIRREGWINIYPPTTELMGSVASCADIWPTKKAAMMADYSGSISTIKIEWQE